MVAAPIVDNILAIAIFGRQAVAAVECMVRTGAAFIAVIAAVVVAMIATMVIAMAVLIAVTVIVMMIVGEDGASC